MTATAISSIATGILIVCIELVRRRNKRNRRIRWSRTNFGRDSVVSTRDVADVERKIRRIQKEGADGLFLVVDFDHTVTDFSGKQCHDLIESSTIMSSVRGYREDWQELWRICKEEQEAGTYVLQQWWERAHAILVQHHFRRSYVARMLDAEGPIRLRSGMRDLFEFCRARSIPIAIVSAGITNFIDTILRREDMLHDNVAILANEMIWSKEEETDARLVCFSSPAVHPGSKGQIRELRGAFFEKHAGRRNVVVLGDSIHDASAARNVLGQTDARTLSVGFLKPANDDGTFGWRKLPKDTFVDAFDVLIEGDRSAAGVVELIRGLAR